MLIPAHRIFHAIRDEFAKLAAQLSDSHVDGSAAQSIANGLLMLTNREAGGCAALRRRIDEVEAIVIRIEEAVGGTEAEVSRQLREIHRICEDARQRESLVELEVIWRDCLAEIQACVLTMNASRNVAESAKGCARAALVEWEAEYLQSQGAALSPDGSQASSYDVTRDKLRAYLRDRFSDPELELVSFQPLAGGFGKQTVIFDVAGKALSGSFVMRRDIGSRPSVANDCHAIRDEYPVIKAAFERGFPAPDALWLDTEHRLLPGGDFIVMRRSPGKLPGNFFGARTAVPARLTVALADVMAQLHRLPPLTELGDLTDSICTERWALSKSACTARYIQDWHDLYLRTEHTPSPALVAIFGWLLDNVPDRSGPPSLLHGDIGFHNFLFDDDRLSAVLDWEFAHVGDPAEELGYVKVTVGGTIDWDQLMARYVAAGGEPVDEKALRYFQVWAYARNAAGGNLLSTLLATGDAPDLKLAILPVMHIPHFIRGAQALIDEA